MRKLPILLLALALLFTSCSSNGADGADGKDATASAPNVHIVNSAWDTVYETTLDDRSVDSADFIDLMVSTYNSAHTDDQWRVIYGDVPPITAAPTADAYIIDGNLKKLVEAKDINRAGLSDRREALREVAADKAGTLYIDRDPPNPSPAPAPVLTDYERYAVYLIAASGAILYEEHCENWQKDGWPSITAIFLVKVNAYETQAKIDGQGEFVVSGRSYP